MGWKIKKQNIYSPYSPNTPIYPSDHPWGAKPMSAMKCGVRFGTSILESARVLGAVVLGAVVLGAVVLGSASVVIGVLGAVVLGVKRSFCRRAMVKGSFCQGSGRRSELFLMNMYKQEWYERASPRGRLPGRQP